MKRVLLVLALMFAGVALNAQTNGSDEGAIRAAIAAQATAWNRADIPSFMQTYEDSPETTFIGSTVRKGYGPILERYRQAYATPEQMGRLSFSNLDVRLLPGSCGSAEYAVVTGNFHLVRAAKGQATQDDGISSLVWHKGPEGWKIVLDHSSLCGESEVRCLS
jgi:uncharacterized protein (TIGR02246 family)